LLPPYELKNKEFTKVVRGYSTIEVDEHIDFIIEKYTELYRNNDELERRLKLLESNLGEFKNDEESIRSALVNAQRAASKIIDDANERAEVILRTAKTNCNKVLAGFRADIEAEREGLLALRREVEEFKAKTYSQYQTHIQYLEEISSGYKSEKAKQIVETNYMEKALELVKKDIALEADAIRAKENREEEDFGLLIPENKTPAAIPAVMDSPAAEEIKTAAPDAEKISADETVSFPAIGKHTAEPEENTDTVAFKPVEEAKVFEPKKKKDKPAKKTFGFSVKDTIRELNKKFKNADDDEKDPFEDTDEFDTTDDIPAVKEEKADKKASQDDEYLEFIKNVTNTDSKSENK